MCPQYRDAPGVGYLTIKLQNSTWYKCLNPSLTGSHTYVRMYVRTYTHLYRRMYIRRHVWKTEKLPNIQADCTLGCIVRTWILEPNWQKNSYLNAKYAHVFSTKSMPDVVIWKPKSNWICYPWIGMRVCYIKVVTIILGKNKRTMMVLYCSPEQTALQTYCWSFSQVHCSKIFV